MNYFFNQYAPAPLYVTCTIAENSFDQENQYCDGTEEYHRKDDELSEKSKLDRLIAEFYEEYKTEADCSEAIYSKICEHGLTCGNCRGQDFERGYAERMAKCRRCKKRMSITSGTFFAGMRKPRAWLLPIWLMERGEQVSKNKLHEILKISYSTVWEICTRITFVLMTAMRQEVQEASLPSSCFISRVFRRSILTPATMHPSTEEIYFQFERSSRYPAGGTQDETESQQMKYGHDQSANFTDSNQVTIGLHSAGQTERRNQSEEKQPNNGSISEEDRRVYDTVTAQPISFDKLCHSLSMETAAVSASLTNLELEGLIERTAGNSYFRTTRNGQGSHKHKAKSERFEESFEPSMKTRNRLFKEPIATLRACLNFISKKFQGVARKYLQNYAAAYWCHWDRLRWSNSALLTACSKFTYISRADLLAYVSPGEIQLVPESLVIWQH